MIRPLLAFLAAVVVGGLAASVVVGLMQVTHFRCTPFNGGYAAEPGQPVTDWACPEGLYVAAPFVATWIAVTLLTFVGLVALSLRPRRGRTAA